MAIDLLTARTYILVHWMLACHSEIRKEYFPMENKGKVKDNTALLLGNVLTEINTDVQMGQRKRGDDSIPFVIGEYHSDSSEFCILTENIPLWAPIESRLERFPNELTAQEHKWAYLSGKEPTDIRKMLIKPLYKTASDRLIELYSTLEFKDHPPVAADDPKSLSVHELFSYWHEIKEIDLALLKDKLDDRGRNIIDSAKIELHGKLPWLGYVQILKSDESGKDILISKINPEDDFIKEALERQKRNKQGGNPVLEALSMSVDVSMAAPAIDEGKATQEENKNLKAKEILEDKNQKNTSEHIEKAFNAQSSTIFEYEAYVISKEDTIISFPKVPRNAWIDRFDKNNDIARNFRKDRRALDFCISNLNRSLFGVLNSKIFHKIQDAYLAIYPERRKMINDEERIFIQFGWVAINAVDDLGDADKDRIFSDLADHFDDYQEEEFDLVAVYSGLKYENFLFLMKEYIRENGITENTKLALCDRDTLLDYLSYYPGIILDAFNLNRLFSEGEQDEVRPVEKEIVFVCLECARIHRYKPVKCTNCGSDIFQAINRKK